MLTLSNQRTCWSSCILPRLERKNLENGICKSVLQITDKKFGLNITAIQVFAVKIFLNDSD